MDNTILLYATMNLGYFEITKLVYFMYLDIDKLVNVSISYYAK